MLRLKIVNQIFGTVGLDDTEAERVDEITVMGIGVFVCFVIFMSSSLHFYYSRLLENVNTFYKKIIALQCDNFDFRFWEASCELIPQVDCFAVALESVHVFTVHSYFVFHGVTSLSISQLSVMLATL